MNEPQRKQYWSKDSKIERAVQRKETNISNYQRQQETSIAVTSAIRDASQWCMQHPDWKDASLTDNDRMEWIDRVARDFLEFYAKNRTLYSEIYEKIKDRYRRYDEEREENEGLERVADYEERVKEKAEQEEKNKKQTDA